MIQTLYEEMYIYIICRQIKEFQAKDAQMHFCITMTQFSKHIVNLFTVPYLSVYNIMQAILS